MNFCDGCVCVSHLSMLFSAFCVVASVFDILSVNFSVHSFSFALTHHALVRFHFLFSARVCLPSTHSHSALVSVRIFPPSLSHQICEHQTSVTTNKMWTPTECNKYRKYMTNIGAPLSSEVKSVRIAAQQWTLFNYSTWKPKTDFNSFFPLFLPFCSWNLVRYFVRALYGSGHRIVIPLSNNGNNNNEDDRTCLRVAVTGRAVSAPAQNSWCNYHSFGSLSFLIFHAHALSSLFSTIKKWRTCSPK